MNENLKDGDVLLVREKGSNELKVAGMDRNGKLKSGKPEENADNPDFLKIDRQGNMLENFFANFKRQVKEPTRFEFYLVPMDKLRESMQKLQDAFKNPDNPADKALLDRHRVDPDDFLKKQAQAREQAQEQSPSSRSSQSSRNNHAIDESRVNWSQLESIGVSRDTLEKTGNLDRLLNWLKTNLLPIRVKTEAVTVNTDARLALRETPEGDLSISVHALRREPELDRPYFGVRFSENDVENLLKTGNLGRIAEAEFKQGEKTPVYLSVDRQTNELVACRADRVKIPEQIKDMELNHRQKQDLAEGKAVWMEGMTSKKGKPFDAFVQFNADRRGFEFRFDNDRRQEQNQKQGSTQEYRQRNGQGDVPETFRKKELTDEQRSSLAEGKTVHVDGLTDKKGKGYSGYITLNKETGRTDFMFPKDYKDALAAGKVIADDRHKTQVAVNSEGKTNEATKQAQANGEPVKKEQSRPDGKQTEKQEKEKPKRSRGMKM